MQSVFIYNLCLWFIFKYFLCGVLLMVNHPDIGEKNIQYILELNKFKKQY